MVDPENRTYPNSPSSTGTSSSTAGASTPGNDSSKRDEVKDRARQTTEDVKDAARQQAEGMFDQQKGAAAEQAEKLATVFRRMAEEFDHQDQRQFSGYANNLARCTDDISQRLREKDLSSLVTQAQEYSRRQPAVFLGGAIAAGFLLARFLRSSNQHGEASGTGTVNQTATDSTTGLPGSQPH